MIAHAAAGWRDGWFVVPHQVIFRDVDAYGHVNHSVFFTFFEWARTLLWFELVQRPHEARGLGFIVAHAECDYRAQVAMEPIEIRTRVGEMRQTSVEFLYEIWKVGGQQIAATGRVVVVMFDWSSQSKQPVTDEFRSRVELLQTSEA